MSSPSAPLSSSSVRMRIRASSCSQATPRRHLQIARKSASVTTEIALGVVGLAVTLVLWLALELKAGAARRAQKEARHARRLATLLLQLRGRPRDPRTGRFTKRR